MEGLDRLDELLAASGPSRATGTIRVGELPGGAAIDVPYTVLRGGPGPVVWSMAARDGDEVHATLVAMELLSAVAPEELRGALVVMPIANVPGFGVLSREHPLAPTYLEQQMDDRFFDLIAGRGGSFVDLHSAGVPSDTVDWTLSVAGDERSLEMAHAYGSPFVYEHHVGGGADTDHGLLDDALYVRLSRAGVPSILIEAGGGLPPVAATVTRAVNGVRNVLRRVGAIEETVAPTTEPRLLHGFRIVTPARGGLFVDGIALGREVEVGQRLSRIVDPHGATVEEILAPVAGVVLTVPLNPAVGTGTWAYEIGW